MISIPADIFESHLGLWISQQVRTCRADEKDAFTFLEKIFSAQMFERDRGEKFPFIGDIKLSEAEVDIIRSNRFEASGNPEIRAYVLDLLRQTVKDKRPLAKAASDAYLELTDKTRSVWFMIRAITVRSIKPLKSVEFVSSIANLLPNIHPNWYRQISEELRKSYSPEELEPCVGVIRDRMLEIPDLKHRDDERACLDALKAMGSITDNEWHYKKALSFETELDYSNSQKDEHIILAPAPQIAQNAFNEIYPIRLKFPEDCERIRGKLIKEQKFFSDILQQVGVKQEIKVSAKYLKHLDNAIGDMDLSNPVSVIANIVSWPFVPADAYLRYCKEAAKASPMLTMAFGRAMLGDEGQTIGSALPEESLRIEAHRYCRLHSKCAVVKILLAYWSQKSDFDEESLGQRLMKEKSSPFVEPDRKAIWAHGFVAAMKDDFLTSMHLLLPQIERYLVKAAEHYCGTLKSYERKDHQDEGGLKKTLDCLRSHLCDGMYDELYFYLLNGADTNLGSNIAHGLWSANRIIDEGPYLFRLALKMCYRERELLES